MLYIEEILSSSLSTLPTSSNFINSSDNCIAFVLMYTNFFTLLPDKLFLSLVWTNPKVENFCLDAALEQVMAKTRRANSCKTGQLFLSNCQYSKTVLLPLRSILKQKVSFSFCYS